MSTFVWTEKGNKIHISEDGWGTRCGWPVHEKASADDVTYYWPPCSKCLRESA